MYVNPNRSTSSWSPRRVAAFMLLVALIAAACGSDDAADTAADTSAAADDAAPSPTPRGGARKARSP